MYDHIRDYNLKMCILTVKHEYLTRDEQLDKAREYIERKRLYTILLIDDVRATQCTMLVWELYGKFQTLRSNLFKEISINLREEVDNFHRVQPYNERQKDLTKNI